MSLNPDLNQIFDRIANGEETEGDMQTLRQLLNARQGQNSIQIGKYHVNITEGRDIQIGDRIYQGVDAETIRKIIYSLLQEFQTSSYRCEESLEEKTFAEYYKRAAELITDSYLRNKKLVMDNRCIQNLDRATRLYKHELSSEKVNYINEEIIKIFESYVNPFQEQIQELKLTIEKYGASSVQVNEWLEDSPKFILDRRFISIFCSLVCYQLYLEDSLEVAYDFTQDIIKMYPDSLLAYITRIIILFKGDRLNKSLETVKLAKKFYEKQGNRKEELKLLEEFQAENKNQKKIRWNRFCHSFFYKISAIIKLATIG